MSDLLELGIFILAGLAWLLQAVARRLRARVERVGAARVCLEAIGVWWLAGALWRAL